MLEQLGLWLVDTIGRMGYAGIVILMALESSVLPVPSELVMPPAGYLAARGEMSLGIALVCGTAGSCAGAWANYWIASRLGRWVFVRYGKWVLLTERSLSRTERFFARHGEIATFIGRLFPVIRHLVSIPAGIARMPLRRFFAYTAAGAAIWCAVLLGIGWVIGQAGGTLTREVLRAYSHRAVLYVVPAVIALLVGYWLWQRRRVTAERHSGRTASGASGAQSGDGASAAGAGAGDGRAG